MTRPRPPCFTGAAGSVAERRGTAGATAAVRSKALTDALYPPDWTVTDTPERMLGLYAYIALANTGGEILERTREICAKRGQSLSVEGDPERIREGEQYWLYRTKSTTVVFKQTHVVAVDSERCASTIRLRRTVSSRAGVP